MDRKNWQSSSDRHMENRSMGKSVYASQAPVNQHHVILPDGIEIEVQIHNVFCNYELPLHIDLRQVAYGSINVDYDRARGILHKQLRNPSCSVKIYNSGKVVIQGCKSEDDCKRVARAIGRMIQKNMGRLDQRICIRKYRISNILATCRMPFDIRIQELGRKYSEATYEPELMVGLEWNFNEPKANLRIHTTGTIVVTGATSEANVIQSIEKIYPLLKGFTAERNSDTKNDLDPLLLETATRNRRRRHAQQFEDSRLMSPIDRYNKTMPKRPRHGREQIQGTGIYNNNVYHSDEDDLEENFELDDE